MNQRKEAVALLEALPSHLFQDALSFLQGLKRSSDCLLLDRLGNSMQHVLPFIESASLSRVSGANRDFRQMASIVLSKRHVLLTRALMGASSERFSIFRMKSNDWTGHNPLFRTIWSFILSLSRGVSSGSARFYEDAAVLLAHGADPNARLSVYERSGLSATSRINACRYCCDARERHTMRWEINQVSLFETLSAYATYANYTEVESMRSLFERFGGRVQRDLPTEDAMLRCGRILPEACPFFFNMFREYGLEGDAKAEEEEEGTGEEEEESEDASEDGEIDDALMERFERELPMWWLQDEMQRRRERGETL